MQKKEIFVEHELNGASTGNTVSADATAEGYAWVSSETVPVGSPDRLDLDC